MNVPSAQSVEPFLAETVEPGEASGGCRDDVLGDVVASFANIARNSLEEDNFMKSQ